MRKRNKRVYLVFIIALFSLIYSLSFGSDIQNNSSFTAQIKSRNDFKFTLSEPRITYSIGHHSEQSLQNTILINGVYVHFDYINKIDFGELFSETIDKVGYGPLRKHSPVIVTLVNGKRFKSWYTYYGVPEAIIGKSNTGYKEISMIDVSSIMLQNVVDSAIVPDAPPPSKNMHSVFVTVTDKNNISTNVSDFSFYAYQENTVWSPPIITDEIYHHIPTKSGDLIKFDKIEKIEFMKWKGTDTKVKITLKNGNTSTVHLWFNPRKFPASNENGSINAEGVAALGKFDVPIEKIKSILFHKRRKL